MTAAGPLRHRGDRARPGRAAAARARAAGCSWPPGCGCRACRVREAPLGAAAVATVGVRRCRSPPRSTPTGPGGTTAAGTLRRRQGRHVRLDPPVRPARLAARRDHAAERQVRAAALLEGRDARHASTACAGARRGSTTQHASGVAAAREPEGRWDYYECNPRWDERSASRSARSPPTCWWARARRYFVDGVGRARRLATAPIRLATTALEKGDSYTVRAYAPNPTAQQMRGRPGAAARRLLPYTTIELPEPGGSAPGGAAQGDAARGRRRGRRHVSSRSAATPSAATRAPSAAIHASVYARMYGLATAAHGAPSRRLRRRQAASSATSSEQLQLQREAGRARPIPLTGSCSATARLLPAVLGRDGADAAHGGHPGAGGGRLRAGLLQPRHGRVPRARPRRALVGRGLLQRHRLGDVRPDARRRAGRVQSAVGRHERRAPPTRARSRTRAWRPRARTAPPAAPATSTARAAGRCRWCCCCWRLPLAAGARSCLRRSAAAPAPPGARRACRCPARRAAPRARAARLGAAGGHHAARPRAPARPLRRPGRGGLRRRRSGPPLRPACAGRAGPERAPGAAPGAALAGAWAAGLRGLLAIPPAGPRCSAAPPLSTLRLALQHLV